jgi:hypothetical protein
MKKVLFFSIISLVFMSLSISAAPKPEPKVDIQEQTTLLRGIVSDNLTNETLAGAVITVNGQKVYSDLDGNFSISNLCTGKCKLKISMISYKDQTLDLDLSNAQNLKVKLQQR